jgi:hypothetical protein
MGHENITGFAQDLRCVESRQGMTLNLFYEWLCVKTRVVVRIVFV